jgi:signal transduction histidine kinase
VVTDDEIEQLRRYAKALEEENARLKAAVDSERGKGAEALALREQRYQTLFDSIDEGFCIIEFLDGPFGPLSDYVHIEANAAYARHAGIPDVVGQKVREMVPHEAEGWVELYRGVLLTGNPIRFERELVATGRHLELAAFRVEPASKRQVAVLFQDITARKRAEAALQQLNETLEARVAEALAERLKEQERLRIAEEALRQAQKMEVVGQLTGGIAHDFNNMLAVIIGSLRLAQRRASRGDLNIQEFIDSGLRGAERAATLVSRLLAFSRQQPLSPEHTNANRLLSGMEDVLRRTIPENIRIEFVHSGGLWNILADPHGLESAIVNLAVNARDAMPDGGKLTIETANTYLDDAYAVTHADVPAGQYVMIAVSDTGHGMGADILARAFEPFFTTKGVGAGTGLGLSQVYGFLKQSGGHVKIYSEIGVGTTVKLYFPRLAGTSSTNPSVSRAPAPAISPGNGQTILVVEDEDEVRRLTHSILRELGYAVLAAGSPADALAILAHNREVALLMTDVVMPDMNGRKLADEALRLKPDLKILFATGYTRNAMLHNGTFEDGVELIMKPFTFEALAEKVAKVLGVKPVG